VNRGWWVLLRSWMASMLNTDMPGRRLTTCLSVQASKGNHVCN
jgi:hypothetical protein